MTSEKQQLIESLLEMQKKFIACEREDGISVKDYFDPGGGHPMAGYADEYAEKANRLVDLAHEEKASSR
jgi:hypothetical protein